MTKRLMVGDVAVGGGAPVSIQSMCNTKTDDVRATVEQIHALEAAGLRKEGVNLSACPTCGRTLSLIHI